MKMKTAFVLLFLVGILEGKESFAQAPAPYKLPETYHFDYSVEQVMAKKRPSADTSIMYFYYTKSGEYAAIRVSGKDGNKGNLFIVLTRDGTSVIFDEHKRNITIISGRKFASDFTGLTKWVRMDSLMANMHRKGDERNFQSVKTGKTKSMGNYTEEEYTINGKKGHQGFVWFAHVDFNTIGDYMLNATGAYWLKMISLQKTADPMFQALTQPKTLVTAINLKDSTGETVMDMHTISIELQTLSIPTIGYSVDDYSNMTLPEIFQAEMKKRN